MPPEPSDAARIAATLPVPEVRDIMIDVHAIAETLFIPNTTDMLDAPNKVLIVYQEPSQRVFVWDLRHLLSLVQHPAAAGPIGDIQSAELQAHYYAQPAWPDSTNPVSEDPGTLQLPCVDTCRKPCIEYPVEKKKALDAQGLHPNGWQP